MSTTGSGSDVGEASDLRAIYSICDFVIKSLKKKTVPEVEGLLTDAGLESASATMVVNILLKRSAHWEKARLNMGMGALWFFGGIVVTALTYQAASESGGTYLIAWGAILFGGIQLVIGLIQYAGQGLAGAFKAIVWRVKTPIGESPLARQMAQELLRQIDPSRVAKWRAAARRLSQTAGRR